MEQPGTAVEIPTGIVAIVSHDAGGAEILSSWVRRNPRDYIAVLEGPAKEIFHGKLGNMVETDLLNAITCSDWVLTGTSWQNDLECRAIALARKQKKKVISFLDHWVNYRERLTRNDVHYFPDEIWVGDRHADRIANDKLPEVSRIKVFENPYFADLKEVFTKL